MLQWYNGLGLHQINLKGLIALLLIHGKNNSKAGWVSKKIAI